MIESTLKTALARAAAATAVVAMGAAALIAGGATAGADPQQLSALTVMGSDTTQDIMNAFTGFSNGRNFTPLQSSAATGYKQIASFNATPPPGATDSCITPKVKGSTMYRPNGSSEGRRALSRAIDGTGYGPAGLCGGTKPVSGLVDFARSSSRPSSGDTGTALTYVPFARDGLSFAYYRASGGAAVTSLTRAQLNSLFTSGPQVIDGVNIIPCGIQTGSGTYSSWNTTTGATSAQEDSADNTCQAISTTSDDENGRLQEHNAAQLVDKGNAAPAGSQVIVGFSASNWVAQCNQVGIFRLGPNPGTSTGAQIGDISNNGSGTNLGNPVNANGTTCNTASANWEPVSSFYTDATFGRDVYNVFNTAQIDHAFSFADLRSMFKGPTSAACSGTAAATVQLHGFLTPANCGDTSLKGSLLAGIQ